VIVSAGYDGQEMRVNGSFVLGLGDGVDEVAAVAVWAESVLEETAASFGLVLGVCLLVLLELMEPVGEFAAFFIRAVPVLHELFAQLGLLLVRDGHLLPRRLLGRH
jgi:hypothetical protein